MQHRSELGRGHLSGLLWLAVVVAVLYAAWNVAPPYYANYNLADRMNELARMGYDVRDEEVMRQRLFAAAQENGLDGYISPRDFVIIRTPGRQKISVAYDRDIRILPGWVRTFHFTADADQPMF
jgi:hypothetical protein